MIWILEDAERRKNRFEPHFNTMEKEKGNKYAETKVWIQNIWNETPGQRGMGTRPGHMVKVVFQESYSNLVSWTATMDY